jgi:Ran GTPase-activating protein (RanGAP) involved in mRNA processing and transport
MQADIEHDEADHEDDAEIRRQAAGGVFGLIGNLLEGAGEKKEHGLEAANAPVVLPDKRDPTYKTTILKYLYSQNPSLTTLDMSDCALTDGDMPRLCDALASSTTVRSVTLATNSLTHESMEDFIQALQLNESIRSIDFGENAMGVRGATTLARILADKENLIGLDLSSNLIRDEGCRAVLDSVMQTPGQPVMWLSVSENCISDQSGITSLAYRFKKKRT